MKYIKANTYQNVLIITLARPKALNALNNDMINEIGEVLEEYRDDSAIHGVVLTGEGEKSFAAGADIKGFPALDEASATALSRSGHEVFNKIEQYPKPVIAGVNGYALGGGLELAMACHLRIASPNAQFAMPETKLGLVPGYGGTQRLVQLIGKAKAMEYILTANMMDAEEALNLGLVNHVVEQDQLLNECLFFIHKISKQGPKAVAAAITLVNKAWSEEDGFADEIEKFGQLMVSDECKEGVQAFLEKRPANFRDLK